MTRSAVLLLLSGLMLAALVGPGCSVNYLDPCQRLAYRICSCEQTTSQQRACEQDRIQGQQDAAAPTEGETAACVEALNTCTCEALDANQTDMCGFTRGDSRESELENRQTPSGEPA